MNTESIVSLIQERAREACDVQARMMADHGSMTAVTRMIDLVLECYRERNGAVYLCGNGGSAADAQHIASELVSRYRLERRGLAAHALTTSNPVLTAVANDYDFDRVFARQVEAFGRRGDVLIAISTSGNSKNILAATEKARERGLATIGWTGADGGRLKELCDVCVCVPSTNTPRIQEAHVFLGHMLCEMVEAGLFEDESSQRS